MKKNFIMIMSLLTCFFFLSFSSFAQGGSISGKITDEKNNPLPKASVIVKGTKNGTTTDDAGNFTLNNISGGKVVLVVTAIGFADKQISASSGEQNVSVQLADVAKENEEVIVTGVFDKRTALSSSIAITSLSSAQIAKLAPSSTSELLKNVPGTFVNASLGEVRNTVYSRGVTTGNNDGRWGYDYVSMQEDGLPVTNTLFANHGPDFFLRADATLSKLEAVRGGSAAIVGPNAPGGIFNYISKTGGDKFEGEVRGKFGLEGNGKNPYYRADLNFGGPISKNVTYNIGGFYRTAQGSQYPGYQSNYGGQVKGNLLFKYKTGSLKFLVKLLNDHNLSQEALPTTGFSDPKLVNGFTNTSTMLWRSMRQTVNVPNRGNVDYDPSKLWHSKDAKVGLNWEQNLGDGWKFTNNMSYTRKNLDGYSPEGTVSALDMNYFVSYIIMGSLSPGPPGAPGSFVVPGDYSFKTLSGTQVMTSVGSLDFTRPGPPFVFNVTSNTGAGKTYAPTSLLFAPLIYQSNKNNEFLDQFNFNKKVGRSTFNFGGFFASSTVDRVLESFGVTVNTFESHPQPLNVVLTAPDGTKFQVTNPNGISKVGADQGYTLINTKQRQTSFFFGHTLEITKQLTFDWGVRYESLHINGANDISANIPSSTGGTDGNPLTLFDNNSNGPGATYKYNKTKSYLSYSAALNYKVNDNVALYGRYSNGKKAPGLNIYTDVTTALAESSLDPQVQKIQQFELGFKAKTGNLTTTITPFYSSLSHIPNSVTFTKNGLLYNPPALYNDIRTIGVELEANVMASKNFNVRGVVTLQNAKATTYESWIHDNATETDSKISNSGNKAANVPDVMFNITPEYTNGKFYADLTWSYLGAREANFANAFKLPAFSQFNLAMGYDVSKKVSISANINNLFNTYGVMGWIAPGTFPNNTNLEGLSKADVAANPNVFYETIGIPARAYFVTATFKF
jgi:iron complex outermembrane recepter protein